MSKIRPYLVDVTVPGPIAQKFERQFRHLINQLAGSEGFKGQYLREEVFSKYLDDALVPKSVRRDAAIAKWLAAEQVNARTNQRLYEDESPNWHWVSHDKLITRVRRLIARILGPLDYPAVLQQSVHTNGASTRVRRSPASRVLKYTGEVHVSSTAVCHWLAAFSGTRVSSQPLLIVEESELFTVPKKSEIDRVACKEPEGNMLLQRSVGSHIRSRLKRFGIDLTDQTRNQKLASVAVEDGLATIDLSQASDTISRQLVLTLLPYEWWSLLDDLRSKSSLVDDPSKKLRVSHDLEMFSSMGNGFTFELESMIFFAITKIVSELSGSDRTVSVYGDDIICDARIVRRLRSVFGFYGFTMNLKKTHESGPFRESCGKHYWNGFDVSPFYLRKGITRMPELVNILNRLLEWDGRGWGFFVTIEAARFWHTWSQYVPREIWGGISPADPTCLVTGHTPRSRLDMKTRKIGVDEVARLTTWFHAREYTEEYLSVDPQLETHARYIKVVSCGERSAWRPLVAFEQWEIGGKPIRL